MSCRHPASLIPIDAHDPRILHLVHRRISSELIKHVAEASATIIGNGDLARAKSQMVKYITYIVNSTGTRTATLLTCFIYLQRLKEKLPGATGTSCTHYRVFIAALIVASKYTNDASPKNSQWAKVSSLFDVAEITVMEKQLLFMLDFDLGFTEAEALLRWEPFLQSESVSQAARLSAVSRVTAAHKLRAQAKAASLATDKDDELQRTSPGPADDATSSSLASAVKSLAKRISLTHLCPPPLQPAGASFSSSSSNESFSSAEMDGLTDDNGSSSSGSSACPSSSEDEGESDSEWKQVPLRPTTSTLGYQRPQNRAISRSRIPSDTSSVCTVTGKASPRHRISGNGRRVSAVYVPPKPEVKEARPAGGFLSRMWGVATSGTGKTSMANNSIAIVDPESQQPSTFRRLTHTRSSIFRSSVTAVMDV